MSLSSEFRQLRSCAFLLLLRLASLCLPPPRRSILAESTDGMTIDPFGTEPPPTRREDLVYTHGQFMNGHHSQLRSSENHADS